MSQPIHEPVTSHIQFRSVITSTNLLSQYDLRECTILYRCLCTIGNSGGFDMVIMWFSMCQTTTGIQFFWLYVALSCIWQNMRRKRVTQIFQQESWNILCLDEIQDLHHPWTKCKGFSFWDSHKHKYYIRKPKPCCLLSWYQRKYSLWIFSSKQSTKFPHLQSFKNFCNNIYIYIYIKPAAVQLNFDPPQHDFPHRNGKWICPEQMFIFLKLKIHSTQSHFESQETIQNNTMTIWKWHLKNI